MLNSNTLSVRARKKGCPSKESASSEMVSSLALIAVLIGVAAVVLSFLTGAYPKDELPYADIVLENISTTEVILYHRGGENLTFDNVKIRVIRDGIQEGPDYSYADLKITYPNGSVGAWSPTGLDYSYGYGLLVPKMHTGDYSYLLLYKKGGSEYVYRQFGRGVGTAKVSPTQIIPEECPDNAEFISTPLTATSYRFSSLISSSDFSHSWKIFSSNGFFNSNFPDNSNIEVTFPDNPTTIIDTYTVQHILTNTSTRCSYSSSRIIQLTSVCRDVCIPDFSYRTEGMVAYFSDQSTSTSGIIRRNWSFGDNIYSEQENPDHLYIGSPKNPVSLTIQCHVCAGSVNKTVNKYITMGCIRDSSFLANYLESSGNPWNVVFEFPDSAIKRSDLKNLSTLIWEYGDGHKETFTGEDWKSSSGRNYRNYHEYQKCGDYSVTLTVVDPVCGSFSSIRTVQIPCICITPPTANFSVENVRIGAPFEIKITDTSVPVKGSIVRWEWDMGDGTRFVNTSSPGTLFHSYTTCGKYSVHLVTYDSKGCFSEAIRYASCGGDTCTPGIPTAGFSYGQSISNPRSFQFTDRSTPVDTIQRRQWDFGDGTRLNEIDPEHTYTSCTNNTVQLRVWDTSGCWDDSIQDVSCLCPKPLVKFSISQDPLDPRTFIFTDQTVLPPNQLNNAKHFWDFGDGTYSSIKNPNHQYDVCGSNTVRLMVTTECGSSNDAIQDAICGCPDPDANYTISQDPGNPNKFIFTDLSVLPEGHESNAKYHWDFGDGVYSDMQNPIHEYSRCDQYTTKLKVITDCGSWDDVYIDAVCDCLPPKADFMFDCIGDQVVNFTDVSRSSQPITGWTWDFGDQTSSIARNVQHEYARPGTYQVNMSVKTLCNSVARWTRNVTVPCCTIPTAGFDYQCMSDGITIRFSDTTKAYGNPLTTWFWNFGDGTTSSLQNPEHTFGTQGTMPVILSVTTLCGSKNNYTQNISMPCFCSPPQANYSSRVLSKEPFVVRFTDGSYPVQGNLTAWNWSFGDGNFSSLQHPPDHEYGRCGEYLTRLTVFNDCGKQDDLESLVCCPVHASFRYEMDNLDGRAPTTVSFFDNTTGTPTSWYWNFGDGNFSSDQNPIHTYTKEGNYVISLHVTNTCGGDEVSAQIAVVTCPPVQAGFNYTVINEDPLTVQFNDLSTGYDISGWTWYFGDGSMSTAQNPTHVYLTRADYQVLYTVKNSCGSESTVAQYLPIGCFPLTIFAEAGPGGIIDPEGYVQVPCGWPKSFNITADNCHDISDIVIDGLTHLGPQPSPFTYVFTDVQANGSISAHFTTKEYSVASSAGQGGDISPSGIISVICGDNRSFTITAEPCYNISAVYINGEDIGPQKSPFNYTFTNIISDQAIHANFMEQSYVINTTITPPGTGEITPTGPMIVRCSEDSSFTVSSLCYNITDIIINNTLHLGPQVSPYQYTFTNVQNNQDIEAIFDLKYYNITSSAAIGGNISPLGNTAVPCGMDQTYTITNESCYNILDVLVDGVSQGPIGSYVFAPVFEPHTIHADFALKTFTLTATAGPNGSISPSGTFSVDCGSDQEFTVTADPCFNISNVIINGTEHLGAQQSPFSYTFTNVTADQSIHATFAIKTFPITATAGMGGSISPSGIMYVPCGYDQTYTITNQTCYSISDVLVDGVSVGPVRNYTFTNVIEPHTIEARFVPRGPFTITSSSALIDADGNLLANPGRISPEGIVTVPCGGSQTYTMTSIYSVGNTEYRLSEVRIDGLPVGVINPYTFTNVQNNHTIIAIYTTACQVVTGRITNSTGHLVGGLRVELYDRPGTTLIRYTFSLPDGTYTLPAPIGSQDRFRVKLPNVLTPSWTTSSWILTYSGGGPSRSGTGEMTGEFNINQASQCNAIINWVGVGISR